MYDVNIHYNTFKMPHLHTKFKKPDQCIDQKCFNVINI